MYPSWKQVFKLVLRASLPKVSFGPESYHFKDVTPFYGIFLSLFGLFIFNLGLTYGLTNLGDQVGSLINGKLFADQCGRQPPLCSYCTFFAWGAGVGTKNGFPGMVCCYRYCAQVGERIPALFTNITGEAREHYRGDVTQTPYITPRGTGVFVALLFAIMLGLGSTLAEPALNTLGKTTEELTNGRFSKKPVTER